MRYYPKDGDDVKEVERLNAAPWMMEALRLNPGYCSFEPILVARRLLLEILGEPFLLGAREIGAEKESGE